MTAGTDHEPWTARAGAAIRCFFGPGWVTPPLRGSEVMIADLRGAPGTRVLLSDRRVLTAVIDTLVFTSGRSALSIAYADIASPRVRTSLAARQEPWGLCIELRSGQEIWLKLYKHEAKRAARIIEQRRTDRTGGA